MADELCKDMVVELLLRIPVKFLIQCSRVCHEWRVVLRSKFFWKMYARRNRNCPHFDSLIVQKLNSIWILKVYQEERIFSVDKMQLLGSAQGILGLIRSRILMVFNPLLRLSGQIKIPLAIKKVDDDDTKLGFGFDNTNDSYKFVILKKDRSWVCALNASHEVEFSEVWSSKTIDIFPSGGKKTPETIIGGNPLWVSAKENTNTFEIFLFELENESPRLLTPFLSAENKTVKFSDIHDKLTAFEGDTESIKLYTFEERKGRGKWMVFVNLHLTVPAGLIGAFQNNKDLLCEEDGELFFYNVALLERVKKMLIGGAIQGCFKHTPTLATLKNMRHGRIILKPSSAISFAFGGSKKRNREDSDYQVEAKRAMSREEQSVSKVGNPSTGRNFGGGDVGTKKIFVGGLPPSLGEVEFRQYFESYGHVTDVVVMFDQQTNRPCGFGFISFDTEDAVDRVLHKTFHELGGKQVEVKRALPRDSNAGGGGRTMAGGASRGGGGYQSYGASGGNANTYEGRDSNRYMQSQNANSGFPSYGSSGYGSGGYGAGSGGYGAGSGGYGGYGGGMPGYGGPSGGSYGNPNVPSAGYGSGPAGASRNAYGAPAPSAYGNTQWGASGGSNGGPGSGVPPTGQSPSGPAGYGNQGYGYGGYGGTDGSYGNPAAYGAVGGRPGGAPNSNLSAGGEQQSSGGGYMGGNYGDSIGNSGYGNQGWRSEPSQASGGYGAPSAGQVGYGGGYGGQQQ